jgi:CheY-like chemotaxis protein
MKTELKNILLIDDNHDDNFFHEREIKKILPSASVKAVKSALEALDFLKQSDNDGAVIPDLLLLDINMPVMNGWEFLHEYKNQCKNCQDKIIIIMLSTSDNPYDMERIKDTGLVVDYIVKPLTKEILNEVIRKYFSC